MAQGSFRLQHTNDAVISWKTFETAFKARFRQEDKQAKALRLARQVPFIDLSDFLTHFANIHRLYPKRDIMELTYDFAYRLPPSHASLRDALIHQVPMNFQELYVRVRAWKPPSR